MDISSLTSSYSTSTSSTTSLFSQISDEQLQEAVETSDDLGGVTSGVVYEQSDSSSIASNEKNDTIVQMAEIAKQYETQLANFQTLISSVFSKQANASALSSGSMSSAFSNLIADAETIEKAKEDVSEDGYYGVEQTSERLLSFATAIAGDDPDKLTEMKDAIIKGFEEAEKLWGGELPEISQETYDKVMSSIDELIVNAGGTL